SPWTGLAIRGTPPRPDVSSLVTDLDDALCADPALAGLPGRFLFALDDGGCDVAGLDVDVAALALGEVFVMLLGGVDVGLRPAPDQVVPAALAAAVAFLAERVDQHSPVWRLAEL